MASYSQFDMKEGTKYANMGKKKKTKKLDSTTRSYDYKDSSKSSKTETYKGGLPGKMRYRHMKIKEN